MSLPASALRIRTAWTAFILVCLALWASAAFAAPDFPKLTGRVVDQAELLTPEVEADLTAKLAGLENATTDQVVVVTVSSLQGYDIADYGYQLGRAWGIGQKEARATPGAESEAGGQFKNNGVLLIVAPNERKVRIEVGYGLEPVITDAYSSLIIQNAILPAFRDGDYPTGIVKGTDEIIAQLSADRGTAIEKARQIEHQPVHKGERFPVWIIIVVVLFLLIFGRGWLPFFILEALLRGGGGGGWSGGGGGGGFSGGGGSFGGGGSSGSW
ncbi:TPM domain-containing protein [Asticcacaulis sp. DW145]|uniref:TPM domain-containing protein n=1 Tax=Asticcacaulis currens TaxID=2984210 RepID=A0ABT5ICP5_9CAUL|nr:TPM domain-containing protein [Asticcacaulis currens]MDC7693929.1 TPM domain-containing protein [Asticcacaulis currens]BEV10125.1 TPM domain-containing protein [Asticcacaulis sp. DW145]